MDLSPEGSEPSDAVTGTPIRPEPIIGELASTPVIATPSESGGWLRKTLKLFGPGLVTGAADDDPSGIATYSSVGAQFGTTMLWTMPLNYPFMAAIQEISARLGRVTGRGIAGNMRRFYPAWVLYVVVAFLIVANIINIGADIGAMGAALNLLIGGPAHLYCVLFTLVSVFLQVRIPYKTYSGILKWLTFSLFSYVGTIFVVQINWGEVLRGTFVPTISFPGDYLAALIAGPFAAFLFSLGIIGAGLLALPILGGSAAYAVGEALKWPVGLERKAKEAKAFYSVLAVATLIGLILNFTKLDPIKALVWAAIINGITAAPAMCFMMLLASRSKVMGKLTLPFYLKAPGWLATAIMALTAVGMLLTSGK